MITSICLFLWRYKEKIAAIVTILVMVWAMKVDSRQPICATPGAPIVSGDFAYPTDRGHTTLSSPYGPRDGGFHKGQDLAGPIGTPIFAFADGTVADSSCGISGFGCWIIVDHTINSAKYSTVYGHMFPDGLIAHTGDRVKAGQRIATIGNNGESTGAHLHFEVWKGGRLTGGAAEDPAPWLAKAGNGSPTQPDPTPAAPRGPPAAPGGGGDVQALHARQIIDVGHQRKMSDSVIRSALSVGIVESQLHNLASEAVPESKQFPNDGVAAGDYDSVGVFQQRRSTQSVGVDIKTAMDPVWQANTFYNHVVAIPGYQTADPGQMAADIQNPREDLRGRYAEETGKATQLLATYGASSAGAAGAGAAGAGCTPGSDSPTGPAGPAGDLAKRALAFALAQRGKPYVWGAEGPDSYDCSGLVKAAYRDAAGGKLILPHYTGVESNPGQLAVGIEVPNQQSMQPGDIILYNGSRTHAEHVALYVGNGQMVNAPTEGEPVQTAPVSAGGTVVMIRRIPDPGAAPQPNKAADATPAVQP